MLYLTFKRFDKDIIAPPVVLVFGYTFSIVCATVNVKNWGIDLHLNTFFVLVYGTLLFVITGYIVKKWIEKKYTCYEVNIQRKLTTISINTKYLYVYIAFQILEMIIWVWNIYSVTNSIGNYERFSERMVAFREWNSYSTDWINNYLYVFINQFRQISTLSPYLFLYIIISNYFIKKNDLINKVMICSVLLSIAQMLLTGGRAEVINLFLVLNLYYAVFYKQLNGKFVNINGKIILKAILLFLLGGIGFYYSKAIVGRGASDISINDVIPYLTLYGGGSIPLLDMFLQNPLPGSDVFGKETFYSLNIQLIRIGILNIEPYIPHLEFRQSSTGVGLGNIYTAYRSYLYDFGFIGLTLLPVIFSVIVNFWYYKSLHIYSKINFLLIFYSLIFYLIFLDSGRCGFFSFACSFTTIKQFILLIILTAIFVKDFRIKNLWYNGK